MPKEDPRWGQAWATTLPAQEGELVELLRNDLPELGGRPAPIALSFSTQQNGPITGVVQQGTPKNAAPRAVVDWQCGAVFGRFRCDWQGQATIMASRVIVSLESWRPRQLAGSYAYDPTLIGGPTPPIYGVGLGIGAIQPAHPLTFTTPVKAAPSTLAWNEIPAFARAARLYGAGSLNLFSNPLKPDQIQFILAGPTGDEELIRKTWDARACSDGIAFPPSAARWALLDIDAGASYVTGLQFVLGL